LGGVERFFETLHAQIRVTRLALAKLWQVDIDLKSPWVGWLVRHSAWTLMRFLPHRAYGNRTSFEMVRGRPYNGQVVALGTAVVGLRNTTDRPAKDEARGVEGLWMGKVAESDEHIILGKEGFFTVRTVRRLPEEPRRVDLFRLMNIEVGHTEFSVLGAAGKMTSPVMEEMPPGLQCGHEGTDESWRSFYQEWGKTLGCPGCYRLGDEGVRRAKKHLTRCLQRKEVWQSTQCGPVTSSCAAAGSSTDLPPQVFHEEERKLKPSAMEDVDDDPQLSQAIKRALEQTPEEIADDVQARLRSSIEEEASDTRHESMDIQGLYPSPGPPFYDELTGEELPEQMVVEGLRKELTTLEGLQAWEELREDQRQADDVIVPSRLLLRRKADGSVKVRLIAQQLNRGGGGVPDTYAPAPSMMALRVMFAMALKLQWPLIFGDVSAAFGHVPISQTPRTLLRPPHGVFAPGIYLRLFAAIYGLQASPKDFSEFWAAVLRDQGWRRLQGEPQLYVHESSRSMLLAHVDDVVLLVEPSVQQQLQDAISGQLSMKWMGPMQSVWTLFLGREWKRVGQSIYCRMPLAYYQSMCSLVDLQHANPVSLPLPPLSSTPDESPELDAGRAALYRTLVGRFLWIVPARPDVAFAVRELARRTSKPRVVDWTRIRHLLRYIRGTSDFELEMKLNLMPDVEEMGTGYAREIRLRAHTDASWAGAPGYKSVSCGALELEGCPVHFYSRTQSVVALSSAESELIAMVSVVQELLFLRRMMEELGYTCSAKVYTDSQSALQIVYRRGVGRARHLQLRLLWLQQIKTSGEVEFAYIPGRLNPADLGTKILPRMKFDMMLQLLGLRSASGVYMLVDPPSDLRRQCTREAAQALDHADDAQEYIMSIEEEEEDLQLPRYSGNFRVVLWTVGVTLLTTIAWMCTCRRKRPSVRDVATQGPTTYTSLRQHANPRFLPLPEWEQGVFLEGVRQ
jgi:hypothetical protein